MDEADITSERMAVEDARRIEAARQLAGAPPEAWETCRNCDAELKKARRASGFCDADCRDDWQAREAAMARNGGRE